MRSVSESRGLAAALADHRAQATADRKLRLRIAVSVALMVTSGTVAGAETISPQPAQGVTTPHSDRISLAAASAAPVDAAASVDADTKSRASGDTLEEINVSASKIKSAVNPVSSSSIGFEKSIVETPRTVSFLDADQLALKGITTVEDLTKAIPGVYTVTRYGYAGGVNIRDVQSDNYYRGMKRITAQGHSRTALEGAEEIEIVKGPPSPIYGMGAIGGYMNFMPKTGRSKSAGYLTEDEGSIQAIIGSYNKTELSFGLGGPYDLVGKQAGYYLFGVVERSETYVKQVGVTQRLLQAGTSVDNFVGPFRLETGFQLQNSITTGAFMNRVTQDLIDHGTYLTGQPMVSLNPKGAYAVTVLQEQEYSPVKGTLSAGNQPLTQRFAWPTVNGKALPFGTFPVVPGIPQSMHDYLNYGPGRSLNCRAAQVIRTMPVGGPKPISGYLPVGFVLDPCTVGTAQLDYRRNGAWEQTQNANLGTAFVDLIWDVEPGTTLKNQFFYDRLLSYKDSQLPYGENQGIHLFEDKITGIHRIPDSYLPGWLRVNSLGSINYRRTTGDITSSGGDFDWRQDVMQGSGLQQPNNMFYNQRDNNTYTGGATATTFTSSYYDERGLGLMFDIDFFKDTNLVIGYRYDIAHGNGMNAPPFTANAGVSPTPVIPGSWPDPVLSCTGPGPGCFGQYNPGAPISGTAATTSSGGSWSVSLSQRLPGGLRPYITISRASLELSGSNDVLQPSQISTGHIIGHAQLKEVGIKGSWLDERLLITVSGYEQQRQDAVGPTDPGATANVSDTYTRGTEMEIKFSPLPGLFVSGYALAQHGVYMVGAPSGTVIDVSGTDLGFQNVVDPLTGKIVYYANDFTYGGRPGLVMPTGSTMYEDRTGDPTRQFALSANYRFTNGLGLYVGAQSMNGVWADRVKSVHLPAAKPVDAAVTYDGSTWHFRLSGANINNVRYWRANISDNDGKLLSAMPTATWEFSVRRSFH
jgi:outer membrane receptor protein involved in Fe transport